jgi:hypothetical protein
MHDNRKTITQAEMFAALQATLDRIAEQGERLETRLDEFFKTYLDARFPHGKPTDRWGRR